MANAFNRNPMITEPFLLQPSAKAPVGTSNKNCPMLNPEVIAAIWKKEKFKSLK